MESPDPIFPDGMPTTPEGWDCYILMLRMLMTRQEVAMEKEMKALRRHRALTYAEEPMFPVYDPADHY
ncbi:hypothetical protein Aura_00035 [Pseudomonas phage vB_PpuM-Aura]